MNYVGNLYGKIGRKYFDTGVTSDDFDRFVERYRSTCKWSKDEYYETECGDSFYFETGTAKDNKAKFCIYCGKEIEVINEN